jgi:dienelactone hydrolase
MRSAVQGHCNFLKVVFLGVVVVSYGARYGQGAESTSSANQTKTLHVANTYNNQPFDFQVKLASKQAGYRVYELTYPSPVKSSVDANNTIHAYWYWPNNIKSKETKRPAIIALSGLDGNQKFPSRECAIFAARGMAAITFSLPYYNERAPSTGTIAILNSPPQTLELFSQAIEDVRRTVDLLASQPGVDPECIDITGMSFGAIISATAAGKEPRFHRACFFLGGGDLLKIIQHAAYTRELSKAFQQLPPDAKKAFESQIQPVEPLVAAPALKERAQQGRVLMINAAQDEIIPRDTTLALSDALGITPKIVWMKGQHCTVDMSLAITKIASFFAQDIATDKSKSAFLKNTTTTDKMAGVVSLTE